MKRILPRLIATGQLHLAMQLALKLMKRGSHQVEMSDEGLTTDDIEDCLSVVVESLTQGSLPAPDVVTSCTAMLASNRMGFIARKLLEALSQRVQTATAR